MIVKIMEETLGNGNVLSVGRWHGKYERKSIDGLGFEFINRC